MLCWMTLAGSAVAGPAPARADSVTWSVARAESLVWYAEEVAQRLREERREHALEVDSLAAALELERLSHQLEVEALRARLPAWWQDPRLQFVLGFVTCALAADALQ